MRVKSQASYLQSTHPAGGPSGQAGLEQTEVTRWVRTPDISTGLGLSLQYNRQYSMESALYGISGGHNQLRRNYIVKLK